MRTNKNTHSYRPATQNAYRKSDRVYPQSKPLKQISATQLNKQKEIAQIPEEQIPHVTRTKKAIIIASNSQNQRKYHLLCQYPTLINQSSNSHFYDDTCIWNLDIVNPIYSQQKRSIKITKASYIVSGWTQTNYPLVFYITMDGMMGYFDDKNQVTDRICAVELAEISAVYDRGSQEVYDLRYQATSSQQWPIPIGVNSVSLRIQTQDSKEAEYMKLPLSNPIMLEVSIQNK